jgi:hypothetical protein
MSVAVAVLTAAAALAAPGAASARRPSRDKPSAILTSAVLARHGLPDLPPPPHRTSTSEPGASVAAPYPYTDTFKLHSRPTSNRKLYLDFNGHSTSGTRWNKDYTNGNTITSKPYDTDGAPNSFSANEQTLIQRVFLRVREDYAAFDIDVTTQDPGVEALRRSSSTDTTFGTRVVISPTNFTGGGAGGLAYTGTLDSIETNDTPAFIFVNSNFDEKSIAEASSHETGHTGGLEHDGCISTTNPNCQYLTLNGITYSYYKGHANWAPIMGVSYYRPVTQWSKGEYKDANVKTDDYVTFRNHHLFPAKDDYSGTTSTQGTLPNFTPRPGFIGIGGDVDAFKISLGSRHTVHVGVRGNPDTIDTNLNVRLVLKGASGTVIKVVSPTTSLSATFDATLSAGNYYLYVSGVGEGTATTGYTAYGSNGTYRAVMTITS